MNRRAMIKAGASQAIVKATTTSLDRPTVRTDGPIELEITKARRINFAQAQDLTIYFRRFAAHTDVGSADDQAQINSLRNEAAEMAAAIKQTVPTVTWDWLCKILSDEYTKTVVESEEKMRKIRQHYGSNEVPGVVERFHKK
jgi:hypothetical protein